MTPAALAIARRLVAATWWDPTNTQSRGIWRHEDTMLPRLDDLATAGVLLGMLPEVIDVQVYSLPPELGADRWRVCWYDYTSGALQRDGEHTAPTLGEAVALALLAIRGE